MSTRFPAPDDDRSVTPAEGLAGGLRRNRETVPELPALPRRHRVAIVDDEPLVLEMLALFLAADDFDITTAASGPELLARLDEGAPPDLLVTDYAMDGMHGRDLAAAVRARVPGVKVLYQTGYVDALFDERSELEADAAFVEKPVTSAGLRQAVRQLLVSTPSAGR
ncbi:MAG: response regulator [Vicinamibacterales bacterium]